MISAAQIQLLQIAYRAVAKLSAGHLTDQAWRSVLEIQGRVKPDADGKISSKNLDNAGFNAVMAWLEENGFRDRMPGRGDQYWRYRASNHSGFASPAAVHAIKRLAHFSRYELKAMCLKFSNGNAVIPEKLTPTQAWKLTEMYKAELKRGAAAHPPEDADSQLVLEEEPPF